MYKEYMQKIAYFSDFLLDFSMLSSLDNILHLCYTEPFTSD